MDLVILSPTDLKPGTIAPGGRVVWQSRMYVTERDVVVNVTFEDGTGLALMWPNGSGWTVDGRTA